MCDGFTSSIVERAVGDEPLHVRGDRSIPLEIDVDVGRARRGRGTRSRRLGFVEGSRAAGSRLAFRSSPRLGARSAGSSTGATFVSCNVCASVPRLEMVVSTVPQRMGDERKLFSPGPGTRSTTRRNQERQSAARPGERTRPEPGLSDDEHGHDRGFERRERVTKASNPVQHCVIDALCCRLVELLVVAAKHCPVELTWIEACQVTLTVI